MSKSADKRSVHTDALATLGHKIGEHEKRDAIHLAVEPVVAAHTLRPGEDVGFVEGGVGVCDDPVGIVDPFLRENVARGERFWLIVYPRQITSLRHVWTHPSFPEAQEPKASDRRAESEAWLRNFAKNNDCPGYEHLVAAAMDGPADFDADCLHFDGYDAHGEIPPAFWDHMEVVTGMTFTQRPRYFSCSC